MKIDLTKGLIRCIALWNATKTNGHGELNSTRLGMLLNPYGSYQAQNMLGGRLLNGTGKTISLQHLQILVDFFEVDMNFLFGLPSEFDKLYNKKVKA